MTAASFGDSGPAERKPRRPFASLLDAQQSLQRIPGAFLVLLALYVVFTGTLPTIIQALAFGVEGGAGSEFAAAMATGLAFDLFLLLPVLILANHPLGILHPLILAVVLWPLLIHMPDVIQDWGGWLGTLSGSPVAAPAFIGLPSRSASAIWTGIAEYNGLRLMGLTCAYAGFWIFRGKTNLSRSPTAMPNPASVRTIMLGLIAISFVVLLLFVRMRGGLDEHLTSLGAGRFAELSGFGAALIIVNLGTTALYIWAAVKPDDVKSPLFLVTMLVVAAAQFFSTGTRSGALEVPLVVGLIWALRRRKIPWKLAITLIPVMFLAIGFLAAIRTSSWTGGTAGETVQSSSWSQSFDRAKEEVLARNAADANIPVVVRGYDVSGGLLLGRSYAAAATSIIPRPLWPTKPRGVGSLYAQLFLGAKMSGTSIPVSPEVEMYWNFGIPGVILLSLIYGVLLRVAYNFLWRRYPDPFAIVFYFVFVQSFQFSSDRVVGFEQDTFLILFCYAVVSLLLPRTNYGPGWRGQPTESQRSRVLSDQRS